VTHKELSEIHGANHQHQQQLRRNVIQDLEILGKQSFAEGIKVSFVLGVKFVTLLYTQMSTADYPKTNYDSSSNYRKTV